MKAPLARSHRRPASHTKRRFDWVFAILFAVALIAFAAVGTRYLGLVFNHMTRFAFLFLLLLLMFARGYIGRGLTRAFGILVVLYLMWIATTVIWSAVPELSAAKAVLQAVVTITFFTAGYAWTRDRPSQHAFSAFAGMVLLVLVTGVFGAAIAAETALDTGGVILYRGLAYNPNLLGIIVLMSMPWTIWYFHSNHRASLKQRLIAYSVVALTFAVLLLTGSRSSILAVGMAGVIFLYYAGLARYAALLGLALLVGVVAIVAVPELPDKAWSIVQKGTKQSSGDVFYSRRQVFEDSWAGAVQGDLAGLGFGVSAGRTEFSGGLTAEGYGREKGNSTLAIVEELGLIGLTLYTLMILSFFARLMAAAARQRNAALRTQLGLVIGTVFGMIVNSQFEAWFVAPAAPASPFFWSLTGCGLALAQIAERETRSRRRGRQVLNGTNLEPSGAIRS